MKPPIWVQVARHDEAVNELDRLAIERVWSYSERDEPQQPQGKQIKGQNAETSNLRPFLGRLQEALSVCVRLTLARGIQTNTHTPYTRIEWREIVRLNINPCLHRLDFNTRRRSCCPKTYACTSFLEVEENVEQGPSSMHEL